ncbi:MAG: hypothetical protein RLZ75_3256 [Pseudomonadota bacterium]
MSNSVTDIDYYVWLVQTGNPAVQNYALEGTTYKALIASGAGAVLVPFPTMVVFTQMPAARLPGVLTRLFLLVQRIKLSSGYNEMIGRDLGIIGSHDSTSHLVPKFTAVTDRGPTIKRTKITFTKYGHDGVAVECRVNGGIWVEIGIAMVKPWHYERELLDPNTAELREYRLRWWDKGFAHDDDYTPVQRVTVGP